MYGHAYKIYQQSHKSAPTMWPEYFVNVHEQSPRVTLSEAKGLSRSAERSFAALRMTGLDLAVAAELSSAFEPCPNYRMIAALMQGPIFAIPRLDTIPIFKYSIECWNGVNLIYSRVSVVDFELCGVR